MRDRFRAFEQRCVTARSSLIAVALAVAGVLAMVAWRGGLL